jgi:hypothetical protein
VSFLGRPRGAGAVASVVSSFFGLPLPLTDAAGLLAGVVVVSDFFGRPLPLPDAAGLLRGVVVVSDFLGRPLPALVALGLLVADVEPLGLPRPSFTALGSFGLLVDVEPFGLPLPRAGVLGSFGGAAGALGSFLGRPRARLAGGASLSSRERFDGAALGDMAGDRSRDCSLPMKVRRVEKGDLVWVERGFMEVHVFDA